MISKIFKCKHPRKQHAYAIVTGDYCGEMFVFAEQTRGHYNFISIPKNINRSVPTDKFITGLTNGIVEHVEKLPRDVYELLMKQYEFNIMNPKYDHGHRKSSKDSVAD